MVKLIVIIPKNFGYMPEIIVPNDHGDDGDDDTCTNCPILVHFICTIWRKGILLHKRHNMVVGGVEYPTSSSGVQFVTSQLTGMLPMINFEKERKMCR